MKKIELELDTLDSNAFVVLSAFSKQARREKWTQAEIDAVITEATSGDYDHLISTIMKYCE